MENPFLYRALRKAEVDAGYILIPKGQGPFLAEPRLDIDTRLPFILGPTEEHAVRQHQWKQDGFPTSGISTTPHLYRAKFYARIDHVIVKIDRTYFSRFGIKEFVVKDWLIVDDISVPEDDEVILVTELDATFPKEIIIEKIILDSPNK